MKRINRFFYRLKEEHRRDWGNLFNYISYAWKKRNELTYIEDNDLNQNFYITVVRSKQWKAWEAVAYRRGWDISESRECGWLSQGHFQKFLEFVIEENQKKTLKEIDAYLGKVSDKDSYKNGYNKALKDMGFTGEEHQGKYL